MPPETPSTSLTIPQLVYNRLNEMSPSSWLLQSYQVAMKLLNAYHSELNFSSPKVKLNRAGHNKGLIVHSRGGPGIPCSFTELARVTWLGQWSYSGRWGLKQTCPSRQLWLAPRWVQDLASLWSYILECQRTVEHRLHHLPSSGLSTF